MRVGIFSGTFDPVHAGHIAFCRNALECGLNRIVLVPEGSPRGKRRVSSLEHRIAMLNLAVRNMPELSIQRLQSQRFDVSYTLPELAACFPEDEMTLLVGSDIVQTFEYRWPGLDVLFAAMDLHIGLRGDDSYEIINAYMTRLQASMPTVNIRYTILSTSRHAGITSSRIRTDRKLSDVIPPVAMYIQENRLYDSLSLEGL